MSEQNEHILRLLERYTGKTANKEEEQELLKWMEEMPEDAELKTYVETLWKQNEGQQNFSDVDWEAMYAKITGSTKVVSITEPQKRKQAPWFRFAAAAAMFIVLATGAFFYFTKNSKTTAGQAVAADVAAPVNSKAVITLANGKTVLLDSLQKGLLAQQGSTRLVKLKDGSIAYENAEGAISQELAYNTLNNPRGSKVIDMQLTDGTHVWLNAASSIKFPVVFTGNERKVEITGEAYFEVAKNTAMPFKVNTAGKAEVEVLGTHFNVNTYADESTINTTLLEGKVKVSAAGNQQLLAPGQQAQVNKAGQISLNKNVDVDEVMAWKNGKFVFEDADIKAIMRQIERWYDVQVDYSGNITTELFVGRISRDVNISQILKMLEKTGTVKFEVKGNKVTVK